METSCEGNWFQEQIFNKHLYGSVLEGNIFFSYKNSQGIKLNSKVLDHSCINIQQEIVILKEWFFFIGVVSKEGISRKLK